MMVAALITNKPEFRSSSWRTVPEGVRLPGHPVLPVPEPGAHSPVPLQAGQGACWGSRAPDPSVLLQHVAQVLRELLGDSTQPLGTPGSRFQQPAALLTVPSVKITVSVG